MNYLLDAAKEVTGSDRKTAKAIGVPNTLISNVRNGRRSLTPYQAAKLAELIGERWTDHAFPLLINQAKTGAEKEFWQEKMNSLRGFFEKPAFARTLGILMLSAGSLGGVSSIVNDYQHQKLDSASCNCRTH